MKTSIKLFSTLAAATWLAGAATAQAADPVFWSWAQTPPMGWNSWDCFGAGVWQPDVLANADYMVANLKSHGWNLVTIDIQWYEPRAHTDQYRRGALLEMDANGRLLPATNRFPMTADSRSFKPIADYLHSRGLKFGLHLLRGIPRQAVSNNLPIFGTPYHAADIADTNNICRWNTDMYGVDMSKPGAQEYYDSVFALMALWDLDFVKVDDLSAPKYQRAEVEAIRKAIDKTGRPIVFSTSPGATPLDQGSNVEMNANQWRISDDFWDNWRALYEQFVRLENWTPYRAPGHWPDADMIPFGNIRTWQSRGNQNDGGANRPDWTHFTHDEQYTLMTLWSIARSPLILGANLPKNDDFTLSLLANDAVIAVNQNSTGNKQVYNEKNHIVWEADVSGTKDKYVALFNAAPAPPPRGRRGGGNAGATNAVAAGAVDPTQPAEVSVSLVALGLDGPCQVHDLWSGKDLGAATGSVSAMVNSHGAVLLRVHPEK